MHWKGSGVENANLIHKGSNFRQQINFSNDGKRTSGAFLTPKMFSHEFLIKMSVYIDIMWPETSQRINLAWQNVEVGILRNNFSR